MNVKNNVLEMMFNTPLIKINSINFGFGNIFAKTEYFNPSGSIKDRAAFYMIEDATNKGLIDSDTTIIEPTSGNTGISLAMICACKNLKIILTMPESMSKERQDVLRAYGAELVLTDAALGMKGAVEKANELKNEIKNSFIPSQFENENNPKAHYETTANEIYNDLDGKIDIVTGGFGTGGTLCGISKRLKELNRDIKIVAYEPESSPLVSKGYASSHKIQGVGANFVPKIFDRTLIDEIITVKDDDAIEYTRLLAKKEGLFCGISSGASIFSAIELSKRKENKDKNIVAILPDNGFRYLSCDIF